MECWRASNIIFLTTVCGPDNFVLIEQGVAILNPIVSGKFFPMRCVLD